MEKLRKESSEFIRSQPYATLLSSAFFTRLLEASPSVALVLLLRSRLLARSTLLPPRQPPPHAAARRKKGKETVHWF